MLSPDTFTVPPDTADLSRRVLVLAPVDGDARAIAQVLVDSGLQPHICVDIAAVADEIPRNGNRGAGAVIVTQEALSTGGYGEHRRLAEVLAGQPAWSDLPLILLAAAEAGEAGAWAIARGLDPVGNITILERPLRRTTLVNAVAVAIRARERQYELQATLGELELHRGHLEKLVEQKTAELAASTASLHASERLASLGNMAAGLGHDIANLTLPIRARLDILQNVTPGEEARADLAAIGVAIGHLNQLSAGMRLMGMNPDREQASTAASDLLAWSAEACPILRAGLPRHIQFECDVQPGLGVGIARHRLTQAIFNLVQNAGEAMAAQPTGKVRVSAEPLSHAHRGPAVRIHVSDDGPGMSPDIVSHCFEPYFSTKGRAIATGMGLGMVKGIIEAGGGTIAVQSARGRGTTFSITLPCVTSPDGQRGGQKSPPQAAIAIADGRMAGLARVFLENLHLRCFHHQGPGTPTAELWVAEHPDRERVERFLKHDPHRRAVLLGEAHLDDPDLRPPLSPDLHGRVYSLPPLPTPSSLRETLARASTALDTDRGESDRVLDPAPTAFRR